MTYRRLVLAALLAASAITGCSLDRTGVGARDAGSERDADSGRIDSGPSCTTGSCDDGDPCTDDRCDPALGCVHEPNTASCDDGVLCNGGDTCAAGSCSVHDMIDPCPGSSTCDPASDACAGCESDEDCPDPVTGDYGACTFPTAACALTGERSRSVTTYTCGGDGMCDEDVTIETDTTGCVRETEGDSCGAPTIGAWGACGGFADACDTTGAQSRSVMAPECAGGACEVVTMVETMPCMRETNGMPCGGETCGPYGACQQTMMATCDTAGTQARTCTSPMCGSGTCGPGVTRTDSRACTVTVTGLPCTAPRMCSPCAENASGRCDPGDPGQRTCTGGAGACSTTGCTTAPVIEDCTCPG